MEQSFIEHLEFKLSKIRMELRVTPSIGIGKNKPNADKIALPDSAYGEWLIFENNSPKFYFVAFNEDGTLNKLASFAEERKLDFEYFLIKLLEAKGYQNLSTSIGNLISIPLNKKSYIQEFDVLQIMEK